MVSNQNVCNCNTLTKSSFDAHSKVCNFVYEDYFTQPKDEKHEKQYLEDKNKSEGMKEILWNPCSGMKGKITKLQGHKEFLNISLD